MTKSKDACGHTEQARLPLLPRQWLASGAGRFAARFHDHGGARRRGAGRVELGEHGPGRPDARAPDAEAATTAEGLSGARVGQSETATDEQLAHWGGIHTPEAAAEEVARIEGELAKIRKAADFPVEIAKVACVNNATEVQDSAELKAADVVIMYGAGYGIDACKEWGKDVILFQRHRSGPVYLQYEIISPRFLRNTPMPWP